MTVNQKNELKRKAEIVLVCIAIQLTWLVPLGIKMHLDNTKVAENTQTESESQSELPAESEEVFIEESTSDVVMLPEVTETESEIVTETEVETETITETEFEFVSIFFHPSIINYPSP